MTNDLNNKDGIRYINTSDMVAEHKFDIVARLQNFSRYAIHKSGFIVDELTQSILKPRGGAYQMVTLYGDDGYTYQAYLHHLICASFIGQVPTGGSINHINEDTHDNRAENLEICQTHKENCNYGSRNLKISAASTGKKKEHHCYQVITEFGDYFFYESRAEMMRAFPSQKPSTWNYRKHHQKDYYTAQEDGVFIYIKDMGVLDEEEKQSIRKEILSRG